MALVEQVRNSGLVTPDLFEMQSGGGISAIVPKNFTDILNMSEVFYKSGMAPKTLDSASKIAVAIQYGMELGLPPVQAMQNIAVVNGRPCLWGDALPALMYKHGHQLDEKIEGEGDDMVATCTLTRGDTKHKITKTFTIKQAKKAGLFNKKGVWQTYPDRMLQMRARSFAVRDGASDAMVGLAVAEEVQDYNNQLPAKNISPSPPSPPSPKLEKIVEEAQIDTESLLLDFDAKLERLDEDLSPANDIKTLNEIWDQFESESLSDDELEEANKVFNEHMERVGE